MMGEPWWRRRAGTTCVGVLLVLAVSTACDGSAPAREDTHSPESPPGDPPVLAVPAALDSTRLITPSGIGPLQLGTTLEQARAALPEATFERRSDGEGIALVEVTLSPGESVVLYAGEEDPDAAILWSARISLMETFSPSFATPEGVRPRSKVVDVERLYGSVTRVYRSEIESREYVEFERQDPGLVFRLDYTGRFPAGADESRDFEPEAEILSISIAS